MHPGTTDGRVRRHRQNGDTFGMPLSR